MMFLQYIINKYCRILFDQLIIYKGLVIDVTNISIIVMNVNVSIYIIIIIIIIV